jgi:hypothetical protein
MNRGNERDPSPTVTFYNGTQAVGNAMGSRADREGNNSGKANAAHPVTADRFSRLSQVLDTD